MVRGAIALDGSQIGRSGPRMLHCYIDAKPGHPELRSDLVPFAAQHINHGNFEITFRRELRFHLVANDAVPGEL